ncbi:unnamed protein product [Protopolystoma xenopodis]|uniref:Uncharacterized protein n=1 Tax=Protopolystoma xenopodis TaxID=117903 RepID=A0A448WQL7_9PLAT|nr:unnamed protein product [Protopolystoma xenopodis]
MDTPPTLTSLSLRLVPVVNISTDLSETPVESVQLSIRQEGRPKPLAAILSGSEELNGNLLKVIPEFESSLVNSRLTMVENLTLAIKLWDDEVE